MDLFSVMQSALVKSGFFCALLLLTTLVRSDCLPFDEARRHIGEIKCITGKVIRIKQGARGVHFLDFCEDFRLCPFTVVVFPGDLKSVGDVRQLQGRVIEIHGPVKEYDGRAEIVLEEYRQLGGPSSKSLRCQKITMWKTRAITAREFSATPKRQRKPPRRGILPNCQSKFRKIRSSAAVPALIRRSNAGRSMQAATSAKLRHYTIPLLNSSSG